MRREGGEKGGCPLLVNSHTQGNWHTQGSEKSCRKEGHFAGFNLMLPQLVCPASPLFAEHLLMFLRALGVLYVCLSNC